MSYEQAKALVAELEAAAKRAAEPLSAYPRGPMGLTPDHIKASPKWRAEKRAYDNAAAALRNASGWFVKTYRKEYRAERMAKIAAMKA